MGAEHPLRAEGASRECDRDGGVPRSSGKRWKELRLLGKFLGFLHFSPRWFTTRWSELAETSRGFEAGLQDVCASIERAPSNGDGAPTLDATPPHSLARVVWIASYVRLAQLDIATLKSSALKRLLASLRNVYRVERRAGADTGVRGERRGGGGGGGGGLASRPRLAAACVVEHMCEQVKEGLQRRGLDELADAFDLLPEESASPPRAEGSAAATAVVTSESAVAEGAAKCAVAERSPTWCRAVVSRRAVQRMSPFLSGE